jgi:nucleoside-diphosphate-sugar epimerase
MEPLSYLRRLAARFKIVFASSSSVYGATDQVPFGKWALVFPCHYAATKLAGEQLPHLFSSIR